MVANESSAKSGKAPKNKGLMPAALHPALNALLKIPSGVEMMRCCWSFPYTAEILSEASEELT